MEIRKPRTDDKPIWNVTFGVYGYPAILLAHKMKIFELLADRPRTLPEIGEAIGLERRPLEMILIAAVSLGLLERREDRYSLTTVSEDFLLARSPISLGAYLDFIIANASVFSVEKLEKAARTDTAQTYEGGREMFQSHEEQAELARVFTRTMHSTSMGPALAWPDKIDLSNARTMLDIGGGSGAHSIGAALAFPRLQAVVFDAPPVCEVALEFITAYDLAARIRTHAGDMWKDDFPVADLHFYSFIFHDWTPEKCRFLAQKSFDSLPRGGRILVHEMLYDDDKRGPFAMAGFSMIMLGWTEGEQYSGKEISGMLGEAGFRDITVTPTFGYWSIVSGVKG